MRGLLLALLCGCGGDAGRRARDAEDARFAAAEAAFDRRDDAAAIEHFTALAQATSDPQLVAVSRYRVAEVHERAGDLPAARAAYQQVIDGGDPERAALAAWRVARLDAAADPHARGMRAVAERYPDTAAADKAVRYLAQEAVFDRETVAWLDDLARRRPETTVADNARWAAAQGQVFRLGDLAGARRTLRALVEAAPESLLIDDALTLLAAIYLRQGAYREAIETAEALLRVRSEQGLLVGSYRSIYLDDAALMVGEVAYHGLRDFAGAARAYRRLLDEFPTTVHRDDAWIGLAHAAHAAGDAAGARAALDALLREQPDSRFAERAAALRDGRDAWAAPDPARIAVKLADPQRSQW